MFIVFWFLVIIALVLLWFGLAFLFTPLGKGAKKYFGNAVNAITSEEEDEIS